MIGDFGYLVIKVNGYIKNIDEYLGQITERQDFSLNMTTMTDEELKKETLDVRFNESGNAKAESQAIDATRHL